MPIRLTRGVAAVASILGEDSCMPAPKAEACFVHSWVVRMSVEEERVG
jgi:hypothetical protein